MLVRVLVGDEVPPAFDFGKMLGGFRLHQRAVENALERLASDITGGKRTRQRPCRVAAPGGARAPRF